MQDGPRPFKVSIIVPVYNEFRSLPQVLQRVLDAPLPEGCEKEVIVVDDGSTDGTTELIDSYKGSPLLLIHHSVVNFGKGAAIRVGLAKATGDFILIQDGDLEYDPNDYAKILEPLIAGRAAVVYGSRFRRPFRGMHWANWLANRILTLAANVLFGARITDEATAYKAFRSDVVKNMRLRCLRFEFCPEVTAKVRRHGYRIHEVPISYNPRGIMEGKKIRWHDGVHAIWTLIRYRLAPAASFMRAVESGRPGAVAPIFLWLLLLCLPVFAWLHVRSFSSSLLPFGSMGKSLSEVAGFFHSPLVDLPLLGRYIFQSYFLTLLVILADFFFGLLLLRFLRSRNGSGLPAALTAAAALALGSGAAGLGLYGLAAARSLSEASVLALTVSMAVAGLAGLPWRHARRSTAAFLRSLRLSPHDRPAAVLCVLLASPVIILHGLDLMMPVLEFDSTMSHMSAARLYRESGGIPFHDGMRYSAQPHFPVLLFLRHWLLFSDESLGKLAQVEMGLILVLTMLAAASEFRWRSSWVLGVLFIASAPVFVWTAKVEYLDFALATYFGLACLLICRQLRGKTLSLIPVSGLILGLAGACKYQGLVMAALAGAAFVLAGLFSPLPRRKILLATVILGLMVIAVGLPWWIRSYAATGTPFYPFFSPANPRDAASYFEVGRVYGPGRSFPAFIAIGYLVAFTAPYSYGDPFALGLPLLLLQAVLVLALLRFLIAAPRLSPVVVFLVSVVLAYFLFWFFTAPVQRYMASLLPPMALLFLLTLRALGHRRRLSVLLTFMLLALAVQASLLTSTVRRFGFLPPVTYAQKEAVLSNSLPYYPATAALNKVLAPGQMTYLLHMEYARFYVDGVSYGDWFGRYNYSWLEDGARSIGDIVNKWSSAGFSFVLVDLNAYREAPGGSGMGAPVLRRELAGYMQGRMVYNDGRYAVFGVR